MTKNTNDPELLKTLVCPEKTKIRKQSREIQPAQKKLSTRYGLEFFEDKIFVPSNLRTTVITLLHKGHPAINKMTLATSTSGDQNSQKPSKENASAAYRVNVPVRTLNQTYGTKPLITIKRIERRNPITVY